VPVQKKQTSGKVREGAEDGWVWDHEWHEWTRMNARTGGAWESGEDKWAGLLGGVGRWKAGKRTGLWSERSQAGCPCHFG